MMLKILAIRPSNSMAEFQQPWLQIVTSGETNQNIVGINESQPSPQELEEKANKLKMDKDPTASARPKQLSSSPASNASSNHRAISVRTISRAFPKSAATTQTSTWLY
ncbi:hypothetical protein OIU79_017839 [Salix purpurea]|uniref:Uncharacterized protein n=1 Tax=Salix purpurea TaxID=77065 RepID=A0A9Q0WZF8_SALPP|nr:hypothetical protein OIU79_017839 [Salix purpurea]